MDYIEHTEIDGVRYRLGVGQDQKYGDHDTPRDWSNIGTMFAPHGDYILGDAPRRRGQPATAPLYAEVEAAVERLRERHGYVNLTVLRRWLRAYHGVRVVLPLGLIDHSGISMYVGGGSHPVDPGGWDSGTVGIIFDTPDGIGGTDLSDEDIEKALRSEVEVYDQYLTGDVWSYVIEREVVWTSHAGGTMTTWETEESLSDIYGYEHAVQEGRDALAVVGKEE